MKKVLISLVAVILTASVFAQTPQAMSYQAVIRNSESKLVKNQEVGMQISILQGTADGTAVYVETHKPTTNANGLVTVEIGDGTVVSGDFTAIDWSADKYFVKTETDPAGGTSYTVTGTSQLLSVAYALHAKTAESVQGGITESDPVFTAWDKSYNDLKDKPTIPAEADGSETKVTAGTNVTVSGAGTTANPYVVNATDQSPLHYVGELFGGGIVFWVDHTGEHGLVVSLKDVSNSAPWGQMGNLLNANSTWNGLANSNKIKTGAASGDAVLLAQAHNGGGETDWYLPAIDELNLLYNARFVVNKVLSTTAGANEIGMDYYWSSTESNGSNAWYFGFTNGYSTNYYKNDPYRVRAVRAF